MSAEGKLKHWLVCAEQFPPARGASSSSSPSYGKEFFVNNVHLVSHLVEQTRRYGLVRYLWCFCLENSLGASRRLCHATRGLHVGFAFYSNLFQELPILEEKALIAARDTGWNVDTLRLVSRIFHVESVTSRRVHSRFLRSGAGPVTFDVASAPLPHSSAKAHRHVPVPTGG